MTKADQTSIHHYRSLPARELFVLAAAIAPSTLTAW